jgi:integrase/recombinase XerD
VVTVRKRDDHPRGARGKSRAERVVDLLEARTLDAVNRYLLHERPVDSEPTFACQLKARANATSR